MHFQGLAFITFFILFYLCWISSRSIFLRQLLICLASLIFYSWANPEHMPWLAFMGILHYFVSVPKGQIFSKGRLIFSLSSSLILLFYFKIKTSDLVGGTIPLGLSFFTFQAMSYSIDLYFEKTERPKSFITFFSYLSFFPQLIAGPICRANEILPQLQTLLKATPEQQKIGLVLFVRGLFKKVILADSLASLLSPFLSPHIVIEQTLHWWIILSAYSFQIYFDFSGYTDMARGCAKIIGLELPENFNFPYLAKNITDFWRRWHQTLSTWFRDYIYIPMGGNQKGDLVQVSALFLTFSLSGIWHGIGWGFVIWGAAHGMSVIIDKLVLSKMRLTNWISIPLTFFWVTSLWCFFRMEKIEQSFAVFKILYNPTMISLKLSHRVYPILLLVVLSLGYMLLDYYWVRKKMPYKTTIFLILSTIVLFMGKTSEDFVYFRF